MDTIRIKTLLKLPENNFYFSQHKKAKEISDLHIPISGNRFIYTNLDWRNEMKEKEIYIPKYWIEESYRDPSITFLVLEFSVEKFLYGDNLTKYRPQDFDLLVLKLIEFLKKIGIIFFTHQIYNFIPIVMAFAENIDLSDFCSCDLAITTLRPFNYRPRSKYRDIYFEDEMGREIHFGNGNSSLKVYEKFPEIFANAVTKREKQLAEAWKKNKTERYGSDKTFIFETLRFEYTLKNKVAIKQKLRLYFNSYPTFKDIFSKMEIWGEILRREIGSVFNYPLKNFMLLATTDKPTIDAFLEMHCKSIKVKDTARGILQSLQEKGLRKTRQYYMKTYCRKTWYNYINLLMELEKQIDFSSLKNISTIDIHSHIMEKLGICTSHQIKLDL